MKAAGLWRSGSCFVTGLHKEQLGWLLHVRSAAGELSIVSAGRSASGENGADHFDGCLVVLVTLAKRLADDRPLMASEKWWFRDMKCIRFITSSCLNAVLVAHFLRLTALKRRQFGSDWATAGARMFLESRDAVLSSPIWKSWINQSAALNNDRSDDFIRPFNSCYIADVWLKLLQATCWCVDSCMYSFPLNYRLNVNILYHIYFLFNFDIVASASALDETVLRQGCLSTVNTERRLAVIYCHY